MFQQTIQDLLAVAEAGPHPEEVLERLRATLLAFEPFEGGEIVARTGQGLLHFVVAPGLSGIAPKFLTVLGEEETLRVDTAEGLTGRGLGSPARLASLLLLRLEGTAAASAVLALGHSRSWSFAPSPVSRIRAIGSLALRLLLRAAVPPKSPEEARLLSEVQHLRSQVTTLDDEIVILRAERAARKGSA